MAPAEESTVPARPAHGPEQVRSTPQGKRRVADDENDGERGRQLHEFGRIVEPLQEQDFEQRTDQRDGECCQEEPEPERQRAAAHDAGEHVPELIRAVRAQHVQRAVREIDDARDAEDQRQAGRDEEQRRRGGQAVEELQKEGREGQAWGADGGIRRHPLRILAGCA
jgi:hypothetical protein